MSIKEQAKRFWKVFVMEKQNLEKALLENDQDEIKEITKILGTYFEELCNCEIEICEDCAIRIATFLNSLKKS